MDKRRTKLIFIIVAVLCIAVIAVSVGIIVSKSNSGVTSVTISNTVSVKDEPEETQEDEISEVSHIKVGSAGDILIHKPILESSNFSGTYDFSGIFSVVKKEISKCDYFVANLEVTLGGAEKGYSSYPCFNTPDAIATAAKDAGIDCLLTANNHCYDTGESGLLRTLSVVEENGFDHTGTRANVSQKNYLVKDVSGIKLGMFCATYETESSSGKAINGILTSSTAAPLINSFDYGNLDAFYSEVSKAIKSMKQEGADVIVIYPHWGDEYHLEQNSWEISIAKKLCELGADIIIGGHPHVVQPVEFVSAENGRKAVCLYSMGNFVSNQRRNLMPIKDGHTEDGVIFEYEVTKYSDGSVTIDKVKAVPTWVNLTYSNGRSVYRITPLSSKISENAASLGLSGNEISLAEGSYSRTTALVSDGIKAANKYYSKQLEQETVAEAA